MLRIDLYNNYLNYWRRYRKKHDATLPRIIEHSLCYRSPS